MNILVIRSTSIQHLALVVQSLKKEFPQADIEILTHEHSVSSVKAIKEISSVLPYPFSRDFSPFALPSRVEKDYPVVVVPASNISGSGFENVLLLALRMSKGKVVLCDKNGILKNFPKHEIIQRTLLFILLIPLASLSSVILTLFALLMMAVTTRFKKDRET